MKKKKKSQTPVLLLCIIDEPFTSFPFKFMVSFGHRGRSQFKGIFASTSLATRPTFGGHLAGCRETAVAAQWVNGGAAQRSDTQPPRGTGPPLRPFSKTPHLATTAQAPKHGSGSGNQRGARGHSAACNHARLGEAGSECYSGLMWVRSAGPGDR